MDVFLLRHGETDANLQRITQGWLDTDLNETGRAQVREAVENFNEIVDVIYSSDLKRTKQTAELFRQKFPDIPYFEDDRLRERNFGNATGHPTSETDWDIFWSVPTNEAPLPGAESLDIYNQRVEDFISALRDSGFLKVLVVTHSGTINRIKEIVSGEAHAEHANASVYRLTLE